MNNYLQQQFLNVIKNLAISNPDREINEKTVYSVLIGFNASKNQGIYDKVDYNFPYWMDRYKNNPNIHVTDKHFNGKFLVFENGKITGNEIKLYVPLDKEHLQKGADYIFDFISNSKIEHCSKIAIIMRNDNVVIRVNTKEDADTIMQYIHTNPYIMEGLMKVNPFLPNNNGIGVAMDNNFSYNSTVAKVITEYLNYLKVNNDFNLNMFTVSGLNQYIKYQIPYLNDLDQKDIYLLIAKTTNPEFKYDDFVLHMKNKLIDKYNIDRERIVNPSFYLENAVKVTEKYYPGNSHGAIIAYINGISNRFTNKENARSGLIKYVKNDDVIDLMKTKLTQNNINIPQDINILTQQYLNVVLNRQKNNQVGSLDYEILKKAYIYTKIKYGTEQARTAMQHLLAYGNVSYFTNDFNARTKLVEVINKVDISRVILNNIDINNLDINNYDKLINAFEESIYGLENLKQENKIY